MDRIVPVEDKEVGKQLECSLKKQGIAVKTSSEVTHVDTSGKGCVIKRKKGEEKIEADIVLRPGLLQTSRTLV